MLSSFLLLVPLAFAPGGARAAATTPAAAPQDQAQSADKKLAALIERYNKQQDEVYAAYGKATSDEERSKILAGRPGKEYIPEFRALAVEAKGTNTAAKAWLWVLRLIEGDPKQAWDVIQLLLEQHIQSEVMEELAGELRYASHEHGEARVVEALRALVAESPHERVRALGLFTLGAVLLESKNAERKAEGRDCFEAVIAEYGELAYGGNSTFKAQAEGFLYELDHLQIGMVAPDFESIDENGVKWKLSDYRGKVVVVDFWGNW